MPAGWVALLIASSQAAAGSLPTWRLRKVSPFPCAGSEGEPGETHMTMRLPVGSIVMSAASGAAWPRIPHLCLWVLRGVLGVFW